MTGFERNNNSLNKLFNSTNRTFDNVELQILFDNIVGGQDEMFFDWYTEEYDDIPWNNLKSIPKERIAEYVNENPDVLEDMEYEIGLSYKDYAAGNTQEKRVNEFLNSSYDNIKISFRRNFPYDQTGYVFDPNMIDEDSKTITFESDNNVPGIKERINRFRKDVEKDGYKLSVMNSRKNNSPRKFEDVFNPEEYVKIYTGMYEGDDEGYTDYYIKKYPECRDKDGWIDYRYSTPELAMEYLKQHPERWDSIRDWLDYTKD